MQESAEARCRLAGVVPGLLDRAVLGVFDMPISKTWLKTSGLGAMLIGGIVLASPAFAQDNYLFQWDDATEGHLWGDTYKNGVLIQHVDVGPEDYDGYYGLWAGALANDFDVSFNIYDRDGLSDTWRIFGTAGNTYFGTPFHSDNDISQLTPLPNGITLWETGAYQTVYDFTLDNGDHYTLRFRSDSDAPEPASWALMVGGFGAIGAALRRRRTAVAFG